MVKNAPANAGDLRDMGSIPGSGRSSGGGHGNPLQYSYLESPMDRGAQQATTMESRELNTTKVTTRGHTHHVCLHADTHTMHVAGLHSGTSEFESELITHCQEWKHSGIRNALGK